MGHTFTLGPEVYVHAREEYCVIFNATKDDVLLKLRGNYRPLLELLRSGVSETTLFETYGLPSAEAQALITYLRESSLTGEEFEFSLEKFVARTFSLGDAEAEFIDFASSFPASDEQKIYASYCSCSSGTNCCSVSDICTCAIPPCSS